MLKPDTIKPIRLDELGRQIFFWMDDGRREIEFVIRDRTLNFVAANLKIGGGAIGIEIFDNERAQRAIYAAANRADADELRRTTGEALLILDRDFDFDE
jgi:hypothetical protein